MTEKEEKQEKRNVGKRMKALREKIKRQESEIKKEIMSLDFPKRSAGKS